MNKSMNDFKYIAKLNSIFIPAYKSLHFYTHTLINKIVMSQWKICHVQNLHIKLKSFESCN